MTAAAQSVDEVLQKFDNLKFTVENTCNTLVKAYSIGSPLKDAKIKALMPFNWDEGYAFELQFWRGVFYVYSHKVETGSEVEERRKFPVFAQMQARYDAMPKGLRSRYRPAGTFVAQAVAEHVEQLVPEVDRQLALEEEKRATGHELKVIDPEAQEALLKAQEELPVVFERPHDTYMVQGAQVDVYRGGMGGANEANADDILRGGMENVEVDGFLGQRVAIWEQQRAQLGHDPDWTPLAPAEDTQYVSLHERRRRGLTGNRRSALRPGEAGKAVFVCQDCGKRHTVYNEVVRQCLHCEGFKLEREVSEDGVH